MIDDVIAGVALGLSIALPPGPVSLVCIQQCIVTGWRAGALASAGASVAHALYAIAAIAGAGAVAGDLAYWHDLLRLFSALLLFALGLRSCLRRPILSRAPMAPARRDVFVASLLLAISNPLTLMPYLAVAAGIQVTGAGPGAFSAWSIPGVVAGVALWYACLTITASALHSQLPSWLLRHLNLVSGLALIALSVRVALQ